MPNSEFLEKYPLYKKFRYEAIGNVSNIPKPPIHMYCKICNSEQTFKMSNEYHETCSHQIQSKGLTLRAEYTCAACTKYNRIFLLKFSENNDYVMKVGQEPPWEISIDKNLSKILKNHVDFYKKGLVCESQGYGVGAYAYYRRITEEIIDNLLDSISELIEKGNKEKYNIALEKTKNTKRAKEKIELVRDLLPTSLRPNGMNPLGTLYEVLSEGLHSKNEDECLDNAGKIREILLYLVSQILQAKDSARRFTDSMRKLMDRKKKK